MGLAVLLSADKTGDNCDWYFINITVDVVIGVILCYMIIKYLYYLGTEYEIPVSFHKIDIQLWSLHKVWTPWRWTTYLRSPRAFGRLWYRFLFVYIITCDLDYNCALRQNDSLLFPINYCRSSTGYCNGITILVLLISKCKANVCHDISSFDFERHLGMSIWP